jgi:hypothetical protein
MWLSIKNRYLIYPSFFMRMGMACPAESVP